MILSRTPPPPPALLLLLLFFVVGARYGVVKVTTPLYIIKCCVFGEVPIIHSLGPIYILDLPCCQKCKVGAKAEKTRGKNVRNVVVIFYYISSSSSSRSSSRVQKWDSLSLSLSSTPQRDDSKMMIVTCDLFLDQTLFKSSERAKRAKNGILKSLFDTNAMMMAK